MISLEAAQAKLFALAGPVTPETIDLAEALGRYSTTPLDARRSQPAHDLSAMDGYAVRSADGAGPWTVVGEAAAGAPASRPLAAGEAARIFTGAFMPPGADSVVIQENIRRDAGIAYLSSGAAPVPGDNVRRAGSDFAAGQPLIATGVKLTAAHIGLLASAGHHRISVARRIRVALLSTGNELAPLGAPLGPAQIPASNAVMLRALLAHDPADIADLGIAHDTLGDLEASIARAEGCDILVTIGGASVGDHDLVRPALQASGADLDVWKVAMRPGKPLIIGHRAEQLILGLPGNPVSAYVTALRFLRPLIAHLSGATQPEAPMRTRRLMAPLGANGPRTDHIRAISDGTAVTPLSNQDSASLHALAISNALIVRPPHDPAKAADALVAVIET